MEHYLRTECDGTSVLPLDRAFKLRRVSGGAEARDVKRASVLRQLENHGRTTD